MLKNTLVSSRVSEVHNVIHVADVHIRNFNRHDEYETVFERLYSYCRESVAKEPNTIIYLAGDIVHAKTDMSPELIVTTRNLFLNLSQIAPVILIAGNHDLVINNPNRLDALTPIVDSIDVHDFFYLKETGVYHFGGVDFVVNAVWEPVDNFIKASDVQSNNTKVVLFHGAIDKANTDTGVQMRNDKISIETFKGFDFGMFGDIHMFQYLDSSTRFAYAGSLIQQNFAEGLRHGVINWNLRTGKSKFVQIKNDWGYFTIDIRDGKIMNLPPDFSLKNRLRIRSYDTANSDLFKLMAKLKSLVRIEDVRIQRFSTNTSTGTQLTPNIGHVRDVEYQNELITHYLEQKYSLDSELLDKIRDINRKVNTEIDTSPVIRNVMWSPVSFEFSNMFSYGENNKIDFSKMRGTYGIFAHNASGKSSILDSLMFCIFDKCSRTFKASQIMNNKQDNFSCKFHFQIGGRDYFITRKGTRDKRGNVPVSVNFWYEDNGETVSLNGKDREGTNSEIRNLLGTYDDFIITAMSLQGNNTNFIDKQQRDRKDLLAQFLDLDLFEELNEIASESIKSVQSVIKDISKQDFGSKLAEANDKLLATKQQIIELDKKRSEFEESVEDRNLKILELTKSLKQIDSTLMTHKLDDIIARKETFLQKFVESDNTFLELTENLNVLQDELQTMENEFAKIDALQIERDRKTLHEVRSEINNLRNLLENNKLQIQHNQSKIDNLSNHEYDPNCKYCITNVFVQDAKNAESHLNELNKKRNELELELSQSMVILPKVEYADSAFEGKLKLERQILIKQQEISQIERKLDENNRKKEDIQSKLDRLELLIHSYVENEGIIKENQDIQLKIAETEFHRDLLQAELRQCNDSYIRLASERSIYEKTMQDCAEGIKRLQKLEEEASAYEFYIKAVSRNGVPYELISVAMPKIGAEVNSILGQIVDFQVLFETDGKSINAYIVYDDQNYWPLEMTSGMERFIASLAIRTALINVSSLPRPTFIVIDEGWGTLDSNNLTSMYMLFDYLKTQFDFMLTISHIDRMRDIVDSAIEIKKQNGYSSVSY